MRALVTADLHQGRTTYSMLGTTSRLDDFAATLMRFANKAVEIRVDVAFIVGDIFHTRKPSPREIHALTSALRVLQTAGITVVLVPGNHDGPDTVGDSRTSALSWMQALKIHEVHCFIDPYAGVVEYGSMPREAFNLVAVPYPHKNAFDASRPDLTQAERTEEISRRMESAIDVMLDKVKAEQPRLPTVFLGHVSVIGAELGSEQTMRFGMDVTLRSAIFDKADIALLGHLHRQQKVGEKGWYAGSPEYMTFGEIGNPKGFLLATIEAGQMPKVEVIDSNPRPMMRVEVQMVEDGFNMTPPPVLIKDGAIVEARIHPYGKLLPDKDKQAIIRAIKKAGASYVKTDIVKVEDDHAARVAIDPQVEVQEAIRSYLAMKGEPLEPAMSVAMAIVNRVEGRG